MWSDIRLSDSEFARMREHAEFVAWKAMRKMKKELPFAPRPEPKKPWVPVWLQVTLGVILVPLIALFVMAGVLGIIRMEFKEELAAQQASVCINQPVR